MSLNGLDDPKVAEAYQTASAEPGGWFLLKYSSRDEVELLSNGSGGVAEMRGAVTAYEETNPLYGFLKYRRRNVLVKYLPEGCSRLIQARVAVHFNAVCERFSPYDSQFDMTTPEDLADSKLSPACSLHAAKGSSSSSSSRKKHLMEIAEEDEEEQPTKRQSLIKEKDKDKDREEAKGSDERPITTGEPVTLNSDLAASLENSKFSAPTTSEVPTFVGTVEPPLPTESAPRLSSQSSRTEVFTSYSAYSYTSKPKVKLGPRPSLDTTVIRPQTAGNFRPVSSIPAGLKLFGKGTGASARRRKDSAGSSNAPASPRSEIVDFAFSAAIPIPEEPANKLTLDVPRPATSSGVSTKSGVSTIMSSSLKPAMTPEKARLKKALQLREKKKKQKKDAQSPSSPPLTSPEIADTPSVPATPDTAAAPADDADVTADDQSSEIKADDSGVGIETSTASTKGDHASEGTQPDSRPLSPVVTSSEAGESTKASSVSESTDQTVIGEEGLGDGSDAKPSAKSPDTDSLSGGHATEASVANEEQNDASAPEPIPDAAAPPLSEEIKPDNADRKVEPESDQPENADTDLERSEEESQVCKDGETSNQAEEHEQSGAHPTVNAAQNVQDTPVSLKAPQEQALEEQKPETVEAPETAQEDIGAKDAQPDSKAAPNSLSPKILVPDSTSFPDIDEDDTATPIARTQEHSLSQADSSVDQSTESESESALAARARKSSIAKRRANVEPIKTDLANRGRAASHSDIDLSDDDSLLEELSSATVHEAKPMTVSKTPLTPVFPGRLNIANGMAATTASPPIPAGPFAAPLMAKPQMVRTASNPVRGNLIAPPSDVSQSSARSVSQGAAFLHQVTQQRTADGTLAKKTNMGSSISQRIKALERLSVKPGDASSQANARPSSSFFSVKPRGPSRSPSVVDRANTFDTRPSTAHSRDDSPEASRFHRERSGSISSRLSVFESGNSPGNTPRGRPETVSVTARIIRDSPSASRTPPEYNNQLELKQSPLLVDHQRPGTVSTPPEPVEEPVPETTKSHRRTESKDSETQRSSFKVVKEFIKEHRKSIVTAPSSDSSHGPRSPTRPPSTHQNTTFVGRLSMSSRRSLSKDRDPMASPSVGTDGSVSGDDSKSTTSDKKMSRAGRLMRRLSSFSGPNKGHKLNAPTSSGTPTVAEEETEAVLAAKRSAPSVVADLGDVNVQFPDTLLWKRRNMYLDSQGFVVLSALAQQQHQAGKGSATGVKKYHLSEFRTPYTPDVEVQELPNSVVLDLVEGSAVQVACEDRTGQLHVLEVLRSAHVKHAGN